tara:strand:- start:98 stop:295 length:198 start_codon:yes stop_codon:yes gene_type:complete
MLYLYNIISWSNFKVKFLSLLNKKIQKFIILLMVISFGIPFLIIPLYQGIDQILNEKEAYDKKFD